MSEGKTLSDVLDQVNHRADLAAKVENLTRERSSARQERQSLKSRILDAYDKVNSLQATVDADENHGRESRYRGRLDEARSELRDLQRERDEVEARCQQLDAEIERVTGELVKSDGAVSLSHLEAHRKALDHADLQVQQIQEELTAHDDGEDADTADEAERHIDELQRRREDLLAQRAIGVDTKEQIDAIDAEVAALVKDEDASQEQALDAWRNKHQTAAGLRRMLESAEMERQRLQQLTPKLVDQYLMAEAERVGREYARQAAGLIRSFEQLMGLERLLTVTGERVDHVTTHVVLPDLRIPTFKLRALEKTALHTERLIYQSSKAPQRISEAKDSAQEQLKEMGLV